MANVGDLYTFRIVSTSTIQNAINVLHYYCVAKAGTGATDLTIAQAFDTAIKASYKALLETTCTYRGVGVKRIVPAPPSVETSTIASLGPGLGGTGLLPTQVCGLVQWKSLIGTRHGRGRLYTPFPAVTDITAAGVFSAAYQTKLTNVGAAILALLVAGVTNTNTFQLYLWDRKNQVGTPVSTYTNSPAVATQRKRGSFGRPNAPPF